MRIRCPSPTLRLVEMRMAKVVSKAKFNKSSKASASLALCSYSRL